MSVSKMSIDELEQLSYKDITYMLLEESTKAVNTANLFKKIIKLLKLDESVFESKIADYYTSLATDKRFILLDDGKWDLRNRHTSDKIKKSHEEDDDMDEFEEDELPDEDEILDEENEDDYSDGDEDAGYDSTQEDLKDLVIIDDDDMEELEQ